MSDFNYQAIRAEKARFGASLTKATRTLLGFAALLLLASTAMLLYVDEPAAWIALGLFAVPIMILFWYHGELHDIPNGRSGSLTDVISSELLGRLPKNPSPLAIAEAVMKTPSGQFMALRFGLSANFFNNLLSGDVGESRAVWELAQQVQRDAGHEQITGAVMSVALVRSMAGYEVLIAHMKLDYDDLLKGITWRQHFKDIRKRRYTPRRTGGVARDWSFGYTPLLDRFGLNLSAGLARGSSVFTGLEFHEDTFQSMLRHFSEGGRQNVVLVGPSGVGKTTLVYALADYLLSAESNLPSHLKFRQVITLDSATLIAAASGRGEIEGLVAQILNEAYRARNIILCLDDAQLFFEEGTGSVDLTNLLQPILEAGNIRLILTVDEQRYLQISQQRPGLFSSVNRLNLDEPNRDEVIRVLENKLILLEAQRQVAFTYHAITEAYRLSLRYIHDLAMPGRAFRLLEAAAGFGERRLITAASVGRAIEETSGVKVNVATSDDERDTLLNLEARIHERMINQSQAVRAVSDALRRARAGVRSEERPIGTFLFLGPTGVGKTELAKALADIYFGGEDRVVRLDLNEFVRTEDVSRLIADGAENPNSLTAQIMKQPFSVVLLDEVEKAHPAVLTTLLQLLDEGILRDNNNREVSFRDAIVIATSNAGADRIRELIDSGYKLEQFEKQFSEELIDSGQFRPEFLNRFDEMVIFQPLDKPELIQIVDLMMKGVNKTLATQKVEVVVTDEAKGYLVEQGYDPRLGARPMRRIIQKTVENTVAKLMLADKVAPGSVITIHHEDVQRILDGQD